ncbi:MAG TPA: type I DNA topoisomerase [Gemmatales bacterium]|nr:type I DNA topoisomerase [Gemmatales bacterium]
MPAKKKKKSLVIVESPAKAKTINKYLGADFEVAASKGHVRDLPARRFGIDIPSGWVPTYQNLADRKELLAALKKQAAKAELVYLAPDPDREGEAIAWHLKEALGLSDERVRRVTFNEITKAAIERAFTSPGQINMDRVKAQETRRFLDRVVGYQLSPLLRKKVTRGLSAGRVQSVAVRLIVDREREIQKFTPEEFWKITATLIPSELAQEAAKLAATRGPGKKASVAQTDDGDEIEDAEGEEEATPRTKASDLPPGAFQAEMVEWDGKKFDVKSGDAAQAIVQALAGQPYLVSKIEQKDRQDKAPPPFTTSTLQQQASMRLRFTAKRTMMIAQRLYEGVDLGSEGSVALITYMRTDSVRVSDEALTSCRKHIEQHYGPAYLPDAPNRFTSGKSAQEGHEAIRPTDVANTPEKVARFLPQEQAKLYELIYRRFVACQMKPAIFAITNVEVRAAAGLFKTQGKILKFDGFRKVYVPSGKADEEAQLPLLTEQQPLSCLELLPTQHFTQPPPRFNEASLVKTLEKEGIGRPSTYAAIISKIQERGYVELKERRFHATELGMTVTDLLVEHFPKIMNLKFTSHMEDELDDIENAKIEWHSVLNEFYEPFAAELKEAETKMATLRGQETDEQCPQCQAKLVVRFSKLGKFLGCSNYPECKYIKPREGEPERIATPTELACPECGKPMLEKMGKFGRFLSCSGYPDCKTIMNFDAEGQPVLAVTKTEHSCSKCGSVMVLRQGRRGPFLACSAYPKCRNAQDVDAQGNPLQPIDTGVNCEKCGSPMAVRKGPRGPFLGCTKYPKCRSAKPIPEELMEKIKHLLPPPPPKKELPPVEIKETCPKCGEPMKLRASARGYFLGCTKYPKCRGTSQPSQELLDKLGTA